jgi:hypothetical protein
VERSRRGAQHARFQSPSNCFLSSGLIINEQYVGMQFKRNGDRVALSFIELRKIKPVRSMTLRTEEGAEERGDEGTPIELGPQANQDVCFRYLSLQGCEIVHMLPTLIAAAVLQSSP